MLWVNHISVSIRDLEGSASRRTTNETDLGESDGSQDDLSHPVSIHLSTDIYTTHRISLSLLAAGDFLIDIPPKDPGITSLVLTNNKNDHSEMAAIPSMTIVEKSIPPLKKLKCESR
jgi:hypothetical protein